jgi:membrane protease YdiL (CAAX protease family)
MLVTIKKKNAVFLLELLLLLLAPLFFAPGFFSGFLKNTAIVLIFSYFTASAFINYGYKGLGFFKPAKLDKVLFLAFVLGSYLVFALNGKLIGYCPVSTIMVSNSLPVAVAFFAYALISAPVQEIVFRAYLIKKFQKLGLGFLMQIVFSAFLFGLIHFVWGFKIFAVSFLAGLILSWWYKKTGNLFFIILTHIVYGSLFGLTCFLK